MTPFPRAFLVGVLLTAVTALAGSTLIGCNQTPGAETASQGANGDADVVIHNAIVYTVDTARPKAEALALRGGRIAFVGYMFGLIGGLYGVQTLVTERVTRPRARIVWFGLVAALMILEQVRPSPESFDKRAEFLGPVEELTPHLAGADVAYVIDNESMPDYRHHITAMWAGLRARVNPSRRAAELPESMASSTS